LRLCHDEAIDFGQLAAVIGRDPALAVKVVGAANSALFAVRQEIRTIRHALSVLGVDVVRALVLTFSLVNELKDEREGPLASCWTRSVYASVSARCLCETRHKALREEAYLAGLLQDIGVMALARVYGPDYLGLWEFLALSHEELCHAEQDFFGTNHAEVGAWLLEQWSLPGRIAGYVRLSHGAVPADDEGMDETALYVARCVQFSGTLADIWVSQEPVLGTAISQAATLFGDDPMDLLSLGTRILTELKSVAPLFQISISERDLERWVGGLVSN
jgi:HD-like signal output (HDOD) protein